jgi:uncharacterized protein
VADLLKHVVDAGFPLEPSSLVHLFVGGSQLHGAKVEGYDDLDIYGAYIEPPELVLGLSKMPHFVWSSGAADAKNNADDVDVTLYSLRRWAELMLKGNPSILHYLFAENLAPSNDLWARHVLPYRDAFLSKKSAEQYIGFANNQRMRLSGERGMGRHGQRQDLVDKYGFDTKFAMHYIRLLWECRELLMDKRLTLPLRERAHLIDIRTGKYSQDEVFGQGEQLAAECESLLKASKLPEAPDIDELSKIVTRAYVEHWRSNGTLERAVMPSSR